ncbi:unnamed protein product [Rotaria sordida]|uniref:HAT C-terminal dimerisation domain-containing protein n=1 Tax=Rotaria sordida TaxID=392033 RepID=A0A816AY39_9BILA|nr:unnamed protein product [Rotaria sordida]CAF1602976.1 unnamed protein product [Rotaria sordida]
MSSVCPDSNTFLDFDSLKPIANHLNVDLQKELYRFQEAFPSLVTLIQTAITIPISSTTCERTFAKMKMIKTTV